MHKKLTCSEARRMDLVQYLETLGHYPQRKSRSEYWYLSPLRQERNASFKVDRELNLWYDHGMGRGGTLVDFGLLYFNCTVPELLTRLSRDAPPSISIDRPLIGPSKSREQEGKIKIVYVNDTFSDASRNYLATRQVEETTAAFFCREIHFTLYGRSHIAIGFPNSSGGYELRNAYFKGSSAPKDITLIDRRQDTISVFEGFFSFLSFLQLYREKKQEEASFLVLNSLSLLGRAIPFMEQYRKVHLYLDRDAAGRKATEKLLSAGARYKDRSYPYRCHKDLNDFLLHKMKPRQRSLRSEKES